MNPTCPLPVPDSTADRVLIGHGGGGRLTRQLIERVFYPTFKNPLLEQDHDGCVFTPEGASPRLAFSTDSYVVDPIFFPGGDIGALAINGTVNDLACCGARPLWLSAGFILEEGLPLADLEKITASMQRAASAAGVMIVTGDTKVVERGKCDKIFINTSGVGVVYPGAEIAAARARPGDAILCSGPIGAHGITIMSARKNLGFATNLASDTAPLNKMIAALLAAVGAQDVHVLRDPTRGGVAGALNEIAQAARVRIDIDEAALPVPEAVAASSELLGIDPLYIANEGVVLAVLPEGAVEKALAAMRSFPEGRHAVRIGSVAAAPQPQVRAKTHYGGFRIVNMLSGEQLPRIC